MSNKTQLQTNNTNLDALITRVNTAKNTAASLPEASGGGSSGGGFQTYSVTVDASVMSGSFGIMNVLCVAYIKPDGSYYEDFLCANGIYTKTYNDVKGLLVLYDGMYAGMFSNYPPASTGSIISRAGDVVFATFEVSGDGTITLG